MLSLSFHSKFYDFYTIPDTMATGNRGTVWSRQERLCLLNIWRDEDIEGQLQGNHRNSHVYSRIAELLAVHGYERSTDQCALCERSQSGLNSN